MSDGRHNLDIAVSHDADGTAVIRLDGEIDLRTSPMLHERLIELAAQRPPRFLLELTQVSYMDSSGVGTIVDFKRRLERYGGRLVLVGPQPRVRGVLEITRLDRFFTITATIDEARQR